MLCVIEKESCRSGLVLTRERSGMNCVCFVAEFLRTIILAQEPPRGAWVLQVSVLIGHWVRASTSFAVFSAIWRGLV